MKKQHIERSERYLDTLTGGKNPTRFLFFDTETKIVERENKVIEFPFRLGFCIYIELNKNLEITKRIEYELHTQDDFIDLLHELTTKQKALSIFAHNIGFDIAVLNLPRKFLELGYESEPPIINQRVFIWSVKINKCNVKFLDTANYGVETVEKLGDDLGLPKLKVDFNKSTDKELMIYCKQDVEIIERFIIDFLTFIYENELGSFQMTLASQALHTYRTSFYNGDIYIHTNPDVLYLERQAYHGGRVEALQIKEYHNIKHYKLDVNSMYPAIMAECKMPKCYLQTVEYPTLQRLKSDMKRYYCIADVELSTDSAAYPIKNDKYVELPNGERIQNIYFKPEIQHGILYFPTGNFTTVLHHAELDYALQHNHIVKIKSLVTYTADVIFKDFINYMYNERLKHTKLGHKSWRLIIKLLMNSLYGKWGQLSVLRKHVGYSPFNQIAREFDYDETENKRYTILIWAGNVYHEYRGGETLHSNPAIAGAITAYARMKLYQYAEKAKLENVLYLDTDCLIVNLAGYIELLDDIDDTSLGKLKCEKTSLYVNIRGNKDYDFDYEEKIKGVKRKNTQIAANTFEYLQFQSFTAWLNNGCVGSPKARTIKKELTRKYEKGVITNTGKVNPHNLL